MVVYSLAFLLGVDPASLPVSVPADLEIGEALAQLVASLGGLKGASALGIAVVAVQAVLFFFRTKLAEFAGKWRLVIVTGLTVVVGILALVASGVPLMAALTHASTASAFSVLLNQFMKQFKKDE